MLLFLLHSHKTTCCQIFLNKFVDVIIFSPLRQSVSIPGFNQRSYKDKGEETGLSSIETRQLMTAFQLRRWKQPNLYLLNHMANSISTGNSGGQPIITDQSLALTPSPPHTHTHTDLFPVNLQSGFNNPKPEKKNRSNFSQSVFLNDSLGKYPMKLQSTSAGLPLISWKKNKAT